LPIVMLRSFVPAMENHKSGRGGIPLADSDKRENSLAGC